MNLIKIENYFKVWALVLPVTSILVVPFIQGTTPAFLMAFISFLVILLYGGKFKFNYLEALFITILCLGLLTLISQFFVTIQGGVNLLELPLVNPITSSSREILRSSLFTQLLYLVPGVLLFFYILFFYQPKWDKYFFYGVLLLAAYGFYEVSYYLIFNVPGDFLSNRTFNNEHSGSLFQTINILGFRLQRMKSLTGEPSMFAFTVLPYWVYALFSDKKYITYILGLSLLLSTSTTALMGLFLGFTGAFFYGKLNKKIYLLFLFLIIFLLFFYWKEITFIFNKLFLSKLTLESTSGIQRFSSFSQSVNFWLDASVFTKIFGLGFGYIRSTDFFSTLLVNTGLIGVSLFTLFFLYPVVNLRNTSTDQGLKMTLVIIYLAMMSSVPEFSYLPMWLFLGIAYKKALKLNYEKYPKFIFIRSGKSWNNNLIPTSD